MSFNRRRNSPGGDFRYYKNNTTHNSDLFAHDPFKIQSYNFHYAEKPTFTLPKPPVSRKQNPIEKRFETYYYNYDFVPSRNDKENVTNNTNKFHESRRKKFLYDQQRSGYDYQALHGRYPTIGGSGCVVRQTQGPNSNALSFNLSGGQETAVRASPTPLFQQNSNREYMSGLRTLYDNNGRGTKARLHQQSSLKNNCQPRSKTSLTRMDTSPGRCYYNGNGANNNSLRITNSSDRFNLKISKSQHNRKLPDNNNNIIIHAKNMADTDLDRANSMSGCHIKINIKGLDESMLNENVTINIETDGPEKRTNVDKDSAIERNLMPKFYEHTEWRNNSAERNRLDNITADDTFAINKRISKYSVHRRNSRDGLNNAQTYEMERQTYERQHALAQERQREQMRNYEYERECERQRQHEEDEQRRAHQRVPPRWTHPLERNRSQHDLQRSSSMHLDRKRGSTNVRSPSDDRLPTLLTWRTEKPATGYTLGSVNKANTTAERPIIGGYLNPACNYRRNNTNYTKDTMLKDYQNMRGKCETTKANKPQCSSAERPITTNVWKPTERKMLITPPLTTRLENFPLQVKRSTSRNSLHNFKALPSGHDNANNSGCGVSANLQTRWSSDINIRRTAAAGNSSYRAKSPVNVNINVYTDKMRLLRV